MPDVTQLLQAIQQGQPQAADALLPLVYDELRKLAAAKMAHEKPGQTLEATALVHEAYLRLVTLPQREGEAPADQTPDSRLPIPESPTPDSRLPIPSFQNRAHFFAAAATAMRRILVERARHKARERHGGKYVRVELGDQEIANDIEDSRLLALDESLSRLAAEDPAAAKVVELHHFAGLSHEQVAHVLKITVYEARQKWSYARAWLQEALAAE